MPYNYIARAYGKHFEAGQRIRFTEYKGDRGNGVVRGVQGDPQYVRVLFDDGHEGDCHPNSVEIQRTDADVLASLERTASTPELNDATLAEAGAKVRRSLE